MSLQSELGISPVLLQAITHTLTSKGRLQSATNKTSQSHCTSNPGSTVSNMNVIRGDGSSSSETQKVVAHILQDMNEPVSSILNRAASEAHEALPFEQSEQVLERGGGGDPTDLEFLRQRLVKNQAFNEGLEQGLQHMQADTNDEQIIIADSDVSMVNVLTAIASHHMKSSGKAVPVQLVSNPAVSAQTVSHSPQQQYVVCYGNDDGTVPSPAANDIIVSEADGLPLDYLNIRKACANQNGEPQISVSSPVKRARLELDNSLAQANENIQADTGTNGSLNIVLGQDSGSVFQIQNEAPLETDQSQSNLYIGSPCPICGDRVSGYHYGIFSCESCKGFFKRTVQNKKSFTCLRNAECEVNISNRKKCPACRFNKCLLHGMKLEAIRSDRTRGGRSYYDGCSPHGKSKPLVGSGLTPVSQQMVTQGAQLVIEGAESRLAASSSSQLVAILNRPAKSDPSTENSSLIKPYVPQVLTDIMNLESFLSDEDLSQEMGQDKLSEEDMYTSLMQLTELRLYKLVRWARNLPQFSAIATDDQILLLQHCWSDLLVLGVCWPSIQSSNELRLAFGKSIDREKAIAMDVEDIFDRLMALTSQLRRLHVDNYEFVALKVLILISPDVKGLKDPDKIRDQQDKICDALHVYTGSHYPKCPNKFGEMLLRLPEISRCSIVGKEYLSSRQITGDLPSCSLLLELIRGENEVKDS